MTKKAKVGLLSVVVGLLVVVAAKLTLDTLRPPDRVYAPPGWRELSPEEREKRLDDEERRRRRSGRGASRPLPEDRPPQPANAPNPAGSTSSR